MKYQQRIEDAWQRDLHKKSCNECSRRKFYQEGFRDGQKTMDWIPTDKKNPEDIEQFRNFKVINVLITTKRGYDSFVLQQRVSLLHKSIGLF